MKDPSVPKSFANFVIKVGADFSLTQGLGGNCSLKTKDRMLVKASGRRLGDILEDGYFFQVELNGNGDFTEMPGQPGKPSIEVFLHALVPDKYVLHLHSTRAIALSLLFEIRPDVLEGLDNYGIGVLPYLRPGRELMEGVRETLENKAFSSLLLANHGILIRGNSVKALRSELAKLNDVLSSLLGVSSKQKSSYDRMTDSLDSDSIERIRWHANRNWRITPDHVVFLGTEAPSRLLSGQNQHVTFSDLVGIRDDQRAINVPQEQLLSFFDVCMMVPKLRLRTLTKQEAAFLVNWEAEKLRVKVS